MDKVSKGRKDFLGDLREVFLQKVAAAGEDLTRYEFWRIFQDLRPDDDFLYEDWSALDTHLSYKAKLSEIWDTSNAPLLPEIEAAAKAKKPVALFLISRGGEITYVGLRLS